MKSAPQGHWQHLNLANLPPARRGSSLAFDKKRQQTVLTVAGETWLWNGQAWSQVQSQNVPPARNTTHLAYDTSTESILLFGGIGMDGTPLNDVWLWNGVTWTEQHPAHRPPSVGGAAVACHTVNGQTILFGGIAGFDGITGSNRVGTLSNETWTWDGVTWTEQQTSSVPPARTGGQLVYDEVRQQTLLFGGNSSTGYLNDMWLWNGVDWSQLSPTTLPPAQARYRVAFHEQLQQVILVGEVMGGANPWQRLYQIWLWDGVSWSQYATDEVLPGSLEGFAYDGARNTVVTCMVTGGKAPLANKSTGISLPELAAPTLTSETWVWG
jgi:hypothetical protein